ncbi:uncharacterized protein CXQ87_004093 [Candidozyma duobushaemuli]|uniref:Major facilitator superfamily (MFS) profile domain-containing protein n=2 Tax=Candidozyma TaxID=3303203 RepID=A0ABX8IEA3_9ASCO|nr:uncharacterized protein CXQ87_004093 [[Candida] duobushaemulonis]PVH16222.1 hypothetical protein CXQ87_004093 [[Candida] duobushaemulonis]QWU89111.1 hypothetical protein CA3LBN_003434 [[Candida] haemuloni]
MGKDNSAVSIEERPSGSIDKPSVEWVEVKDEEAGVDEAAVDIEKFSDIDEKKLLWKIDLHLIPLFTVLYLLSFLDRGNIGNAKIEGLSEDLNLVGNQYNLCLTIFFIFYASMEIPSNVILHHVKPRLYIPTTMVLWSVVMTLMGTVQNYHQLMATRALLGLFEASLFPGISYILSMYYKKSEILVREAIFFSAASIAGAFSGLLAAAISQMDGIGGYEGWRWIFILEGLLTFVAAALSYFCFPLYPKESTFLTPKEREFVVHRVKYSSNAENQKMTGAGAPPSMNLGEDNSGNASNVWAVFKDWQSWCQLMTYYGVCVPLYGVSLFTPTIVKNLGYTSTRAQLMSAPVYIVAAVFCIFQAWVSDRVGLRTPFLTFDLVCIAVGYSICLALSPEDSPRAVYAGVYIMALGIYSAFPLVVIWFSNNLAGSYKRAVGMAFQIGIGNFAGAFSSNFYREQDAPEYKLGHGLELGFSVMGLLFMFITIIGYVASNRKKKRDLALGKYDGVPPEELVKMGDKSPHFVYRL